MKPVFSVVIALAPDRSAEVLQSLKKAHYPQEKIEIVIKTGLNPSENRNKGVQEAQGEIIAFMDMDIPVNLDSLKELINSIKNKYDIFFFAKFRQRFIKISICCFNSSKESKLKDAKSKVKSRVMKILIFMRL